MNYQDERDTRDAFKRDCNEKMQKVVSKIEEMENISDVQFEQIKKLINEEMWK
jgi:hypothetical protein